MRRRSETASTLEVLRPRNPHIGFAFAAAWLLVAVFGIFILVIDGERVVTGQVSGQRSVGFLLVTPGVGAVISVIAAIRACVAIRPWMAYVATSTPEQRQALTDNKFKERSFTPLLLTGVAVAAGWLVLLIAAILGFESASAAGSSAMLMIMTLLGMAAATLISVGVRGNAAYRRRQSR